MASNRLKGLDERPPQMKRLLNGRGGIYEMETEEAREKVCPNGTRKNYTTQVLQLNSR